MRTISRCSGESSPPTLSRSSSAPSRTAVSGVLSSCDTCRRKRVLLLLELVQARAQPFEALAEVAHVLRAVDLDRVREVGGPHLPDRLIELADRPCDQDGEGDRQQHRDRAGGERQVAPGLAALRRRLLQPLDLALGQPVACA